MNMYWFMDEYSTVRPVYEDEDGIFSPNFKYELEIHGDTLVCYTLSPLMGDEYQLYNSLTELADVVEG